MHEDPFLQHPRRRTPVALVLTIVVILLGALWYYRHVPQAVPAPVSVTPSPAPEMTLIELQASVINSPIPDYTTIF